MKTFENKVVWITGASGGIGEKLVYELANHNLKLVLSSNEEDELQRVKSNCKLPDENIMLLPFDLTQHDIIESVFNEIVKKFGTIDLLINNGGISSRAFAHETLMSTYKKIMDINYFGTVAVTKAVLPLMIKNKCGHIVVMSSAAGKIGTPMRSAYCASKHALQGYFDSLRAEVYNHNIKVTIVCPGYIRTNISLNAITADGNSFNKMDSNQAKGMLPEVLAKKILQAVLKEKEEIWVGGKEILGLYIKRFFPLMISRIIRKQAPK
ncbi:MAG: SDR family oxidoreductase [Saprospiraceae bacterium]|nr:SDR family oxidoreductase [Saprospiraceae bacterium]